METTLLIVLVALQSITLVVLVVAMVLYISRANKAVGELEEAAKDLREGFLPVAQDLRKTIGDADDLILATKADVDAIGRIAESVGKVLDTAYVLHAAGSAVTSSKTTLVSVIQGIRAGLGVLKSSKSNSEEESEHVER